MIPWLAQQLGLPNDDLVNRINFFLAVGGMAVIGWGYWLTQQGRGTYKRALRDRLLLVLGILGGLSYFNFTNLHFGNFIHVWDTYHYYIGAKYFPELGYDLLYDCTVVADTESSVGWARDEARTRVITDLRTNVMVRTNEVLADPARCKSHFSPQRWESFKHDIGWFRGRCSPQRWTDILHDHGYNATPVWTIAGYLLTNTGPATDTQVTALNLLDPLYIILTGLLLWWAFGPRIFALGMLLLGTDYPSRYYWTGGAFLRHDWLFFLVAVVCLLKKRRPFLAGLAAAYTTLLRLFPGFIMVGPVLAVAELVRLRVAAKKAAKAAPVDDAASRSADKKKLPFVPPQVEPVPEELLQGPLVQHPYARLFAGGAAGIVGLVALSFVLVGGVSTYQRFVQNTQKHANTPLTNHMGLRTVLSWRPTTIGAELRDPRLIDPWSVWKQGRLDNFAKAKPVFALLILAFCALLYFAARGNGLEPWAVTSLSVGLIAVGSELTNYYYCFVVALAPLFEKRREAGLLLLGYCALTQLIGWAPTSSMSRWLDEQYTVMSAAAVLCFAALMWIFTRHGSSFCLPPEPVTEGAPAREGKPKRRK